MKHVIGCMMKKATCMILSAVIGMAISASTGFAADSQYSGFFGNPSVYDLLKPGGATGGWSGSGETGVEMMALDSMTHDILVLAVDQRKAEFEQRFSKWGSAGDAFKFWSKMIVKFIDHARDVKR
jgi:Protein of unknown function (DUF3313)